MSQHSDQPSICFVAVKAYACLSGRDDISHIGGAEVQQVRIARELSRRGYPIRFVTLDHGQPDAEEIDGIRVFRAYPEDAGLPLMRFFHPRASGLWRAMRRADADIYYQRTCDTVTGVVAAFSSMHGRPFVYSVGHDEECIPELPHCPSLRERIPFKWGLHHANAVVAQTRSQVQMLTRNFSVPSTIIRSCIPEPDPVDNTVERSGRRLLWLGRFATEKRLGFLLDVAEKIQSDEKIQNVTFDVLGDGLNDSIIALKERAARLKNVTLHGYIPHRQVGAYYERADVLINTSQSEGFPNTFLEAWSRKIPVITTCDPDGITAEHGLGIACNTVSETVEAVQKICGDADLRSRLGDAGHAYFRTNHTVKAAVDAYEALFKELTLSHGPTRPVTPKAKYA